VAHHSQAREQTESNKFYVCDGQSGRSIAARESVAWDFGEPLELNATPLSPVVSIPSQASLVLIASNTN
jgi:hypothetical protein